MTNMKSIIKYAGLLAITIAGLVSCVKEKGDTLPPGTFIIDTDQYSVITLDKEAQVAVIPVTTNISEDLWTFESTASWCEIGQSLGSEKGIMIAVGDNTDKEAQRRAQVSVKAGDNEYKMSVVQFGYGPAIIVKDATIGPEGGLVYLDVVSNVTLDESLIKNPAYNSEDGANWIRFYGMETTKAFVTTRFGFQVDVNEMPGERKATVTLKAVDSADSSADTKCTSTQNSISVTSTEVFTANKVTVLSVRSNQTTDSQWGDGLEALVDGSYASFYHSATSKEGEGTTFPMVWEFELFGDQRVEYISIMHRADDNGVQGAHGRGQIGKFNLYYKIDPNDEYTFIKEYDFGGKGGYQTANLPTPLEGVTWFKIEILEDGTDPNTRKPDDQYYDGKYICCAEVEFFNSNRAEVNEWINRIFTDLSCSQLREGVTKRQIIEMNAVAPFLAVNVAMPLFEGTYGENEMDFRIHSYEPYSDSRVNRNLVMQFYSSMNNPTGIEVKAGQDILVCVDKIPANQNVSIAVYGEESEFGPNYGGGGESENINQNTALTEGVNNVRITADGMLYVMNTVPVDNTAPLSKFENVKVHILKGCGTLQGYFDPARHSDEKYAELLSKCSYKYFMVKGQKCLFLFHTSQLLSDFPRSIRGGIEIWDNLVTWELELMGLDKCEWFNNHMMAVTNTNPEIYMNAMNRRVQFNAKTINWICSPEKLFKAGENEDPGISNIWGPAHEMGHINQMAINWRSTTESSNNLFSNYANFKIGGDSYYNTHWSRGKKISDLAAYYANRTAWADMEGDAYQGEDSAIHMRMNWQLWNYYQNCGYKGDFFPALFAYLRDGNQLPNQSALDYYGLVENAGQCQLQYYEACCIVAGQDLTEFFETWGFFRTVDRTLNQYGEAKYTVTDAMINKAKAHIRDLKLPKAAPIQYLEDRTKHNGETYSEMGNWTQFRDKVTITKSPKATVNGNKVTLSDCDEAVAVEVRKGSDESGELLYFANLFTFNSPVSLANTSLWAVQYDGKRVKVNVQ